MTDRTLEWHVAQVQTHLHGGGGDSLKALEAMVRDARKQIEEINAENDKLTAEALMVEGRIRNLNGKAQAYADEADRRQKAEYKCVELKAQVAILRDILEDQLPC